MKKILSLVCLLAALSLLAACSTSNTGNSPIINPQKKDTTIITDIPTNNTLPSTLLQSNESKGVPESTVLRNANYPIEECNSYEIRHNVDTDAHIDDLELKLYYEGTYGSEIITIPYSYQYDRSSDIWSLIAEGNAHSVETLNENAFIQASPWRGESEGYHDFSYYITFEELDTDELVAIIDYKIDFKDDTIPDLSQKARVELLDTGGYYRFHFLIHYNYPGFSSWEEDTIWFWLDSNRGLIPF